VSRRRAFTLVEIAVALVLVAMSSMLLWQIYAAGQRQGDQIERGAELMQAASLLQEILSWDLLRSLPAASLGEEHPLRRGEAHPNLALPFYNGYAGTRPEARGFRVLAYTWDAEQKVLRRDGRPLLRSGVDEIQFRWSAHTPTQLIVELYGRSGLGDARPRTTIRLPAPPGTDGDRYWRYAPGHRGAEHREEGMP